MSGGFDHCIHMKAALIDFWPQPQHFISCYHSGVHTHLADAEKHYHAYLLFSMKSVSFSTNLQGKCLMFLISSPASR